jgi:hypothetical protein
MVEVNRGLHHDVIIGDITGAAANAPQTYAFNDSAAVLGHGHASENADPEAAPNGRQPVRRGRPAHALLAAAFRILCDIAQRRSSAGLGRGNADRAARACRGSAVF